MLITGYRLTTMAKELMCSLGLLLFFDLWGKQSTEEPGSKHCSYEGTNPINVKLIPCVVPVVHISPTKGLQRQYSSRLCILLGFPVIWDNYISIKRKGKKRKETKVKHKPYLKNEKQERLIVFCIWILKQAICKKKKQAEIDKRAIEREKHWNITRDKFASQKTLSKVFTFLLSYSSII